MYPGPEPYENSKTSFGHSRPEDFPLGVYAANLILNAEGLWTTPDHRDESFAYHDETDWATIEAESFWYQHRNRCFVGMLARYPSDEPIWEIGSGNGNVCLALQTMGRTVVGVEPTVRSALTARKRGVHNVLCAHIDAAGFKPGTMANLALFDVLEHIEDDQAFLGKLRGLIRKGGLLACAVPAWQFLWSREDQAAGHWRRYRLGNLCARMSRAGFQVDYASYFFGPLVLPILLKRSLPTRLGLRGARTDQLSRQEHKLPAGFVGRTVARLLDREVRLICNGRTLYMGASCLIAARAC